jgi:hypothetical protein
MKKQYILFLFFLLISCSTEKSGRYFEEVIFIDHHNLRYVESDSTLAAQVAIIKKSIDQAVENGADTFLFFAKNTMEAMLNYDFDVSGIGNIGEQAFPPDGEHRATGKRYRAALDDILAYAKEQKIRIFFHSNQFIFPDKVLEVIKPSVWGTAVCPGRDVSWEVYRKKLDEFFAFFPDIAGFQVTGDETQVSVLECKCDHCTDLSFVDRVNLLTKVTAEVCQKHGKEVQMRTWQRMGELEQEQHPSNMADGLPDNVFFSIKNTKGDFYLKNGVDETFLRAADPERVVVEFDAWREFNGNNYFPCYMGDSWGERFQLIKELGIKRVAVRLNWCTNKNYIFDIPWGNIVNLYTFLQLVENPEADPDDILRAFIAENYPPSAHQIAFEMYKFTPSLIHVIYYPWGINNTNHSRVQDDDAVGDLHQALQMGHFNRDESFRRRRDQINAYCAEARGYVNELGNDVPKHQKMDMLNGVKVLQYIALSTTDKMEAIFWKEKGDLSEFTLVKARIIERLAEWEAIHPESFISMNADDALKDM